ncbi:HupE/UreJ family protein [Arenibacter amylolyticus]|uniref:HupE/UreJ family protein n=1 Tax=Arenibacter amylolyticus TaxID=1406873 RepID=UPI000A36FA68|nr:HupE/UreJ family protein [Arenibacter amylolyticus]
MSNRLSFMLGFFLLIPLLLLSHIPNQSYIFLRVYENDGIDGRFEINTNDINKIYNTDFKKGVTLSELNPYVEDLKAYMLSRSSFNSPLGHHQVLLRDSVQIFPGVLGDYLQIYFSLDNMETLPESLEVEFRPVFDVDPTHKGYLITEYNWRAGVINEESNISMEFSPNSPIDTMSLTDVSIWKGIVAMVKQGVWHIWIGLDHILFLIALILPSVVRRRKNPHENKDGRHGLWQVLGRYSWEPVMGFKPAFIYIIKVITFFTIAHTITLSLASLQLVVLPSRFVESMIALSIGLAALHNIVPIFKGNDWVIAFGFGLFHGFGFASVLGDLGLTSEFLTLSLLGFNIGVELGQIVIIAIFFPLLYLLRNAKAYPKLLVGVSILLILISINWSVERSFEIDLGVYGFLKSSLRKVLVFIGLLS